MRSQQGDEGKGPLPQNFLVIGLVRGPWGLRGEVKVEPMTDFPERFSPGETVYLEGRAMTIEASRRRGQGFVLKLSALSCREDAEGLMGRYLEIPQSQATPLPPGSYYQFQVLGLKVYTTRGDCLGEVVEILGTGSNDVYVVQGGGRELFIPAIEDVVRDIRPDEGRMVVEAEEGMWEPSAWV